MDDRPQPRSKTMTDTSYKIQIQSEQNLNSQNNLVTNESNMAQYPVNEDNEKVLKYD